MFYINELIQVNPVHNIEKYMKIPREIIYEKDMDEKRVLCFLYFLQNITYGGDISYSCDHLIKWCGYKPNSRKRNKNDKSINNSFSDFIYWLYQNFYISDFNSKNFYGNNFINCMANEDLFIRPYKFGIIYDFELMQTENIKSRDLILLVLSYLRLNVWNNKTDEQLRPEIVHRQYTKISEDIGISVYRIKKSIQTLCDIGILKTANVPRFRDQSGAWHTEDMIIANVYRYHWDDTTNSYLLDQNYDCDKELEFGVQYIQQRKHSGVKNI